MAYCTHCGVQVPESVALCPKCEQPTGQPSSRKRSPVSLAMYIGGGCLGLPVIAGIIFAYILNLQDATQNFQNALQRAKQVRTIADVRNVGVAFVLWHAEEGHSVESRLLENPSAADLTEILVPQYIQKVPVTDGWEYDLEYWVNPDVGDRPVFQVRSPGADGVFETYGYEVAPFVATDYAQDIVWSDGYFLRWPEGTKK